MSKHDEKLEQKSPSTTEISGALDDKNLENVTGGDNTVVLQHERVTGQTNAGLGLRKSAGESNGAGSMFLWF